MNIVCATLNSKYIHSALAPWCIKAGVDAFCYEKHNVFVIESTINADAESFVKDIIDKKPDIIAFSCYIWNITYIVQAAEILKKQASPVIVLGGPEAEHNYIEILEKHDYIDFILCGEGEWSFSNLVNKLSSNSDISDCFGLCYRNKDKIFRVPTKYFSQTPPSPYCDEYFTQLQKRIVYIESSRGCPFRCTYCLSGAIGKMRCFNSEQIKHDIIKLSHSGTQTIKFVDRTFNTNTKHCNEILDFIYNEYGKSISENVSFHFEMAGSIIKESTIKILKKMPQGLCQLEIGIQSYNTRTLDAINRRSNINLLEKNISELLSSGNIHIHTDLIAGLPYEDINSFAETFNRAYAIKSNMLQLGILKLLHGADINKDIVRYNYTFSSQPPYCVIKNEWLNEDELLKIRYCENGLDRLYNSGRFLFTLDYIIDELSYRPFDVFYAFGKELNSENISLSKLTEEIFRIFGSFADKEKLREAILCDLASIDANIHIPDSLLINSSRYKKLKKKYTEYYHTNVRIVECNSVNKVYVVCLNQKKNLMNRRCGVFFDITP